MTYAERKGLGSLTRIRRHLREKGNGERGFALIELAFIIPIALVIAVLAVEGAWLFIAQRNVNDSAQEGARLAASNFGTSAQIGNSVCGVVDVNHPTASPKVTFTPSGLDGTTGDTGSVTVETPIRSFSGILTPLFRRITMSATADFTLRRPDDGVALWWNEGDPSTYSCSASN